MCSKWKCGDSHEKSPWWSSCPAFFRSSTWAEPFWPMAVLRWSERKSNMNQEYGPNAWSTSPINITQYHLQLLTLMILMPEFAVANPNFEATNFGSWAPGYTPSGSLRRHPIPSSWAPNLSGSPGRRRSRSWPFFNCYQNVNFSSLRERAIKMIYKIIHGIV